MNALVSPLAGLINLQSRALMAETPAAAAFVMVNETRALFVFRQAVLWDRLGRVTTVSGVAKPERTAPYTVWLESLNRVLQKSNRGSGPIDASDVAGAVHADWAEWMPAHALWLPFEVGGGLLYARDEAWTADEIETLKGLALVYGAALAERRPEVEGKRMRLAAWTRRRPVRIAVAVAAFAGLWIPVPLTVLAPAEIVASHPIVVRAPAEGVIEKIHVQPNQSVSSGQPLFELDDTTLTSKLEVAQKVLATATAEYEQTVQKAMFDPSVKAQLAILKGRIEERAAEVRHNSALLARIRVTAEGDGVVVMDDPSEWIGRPVTIGERVLAIAKETETEIEAWLAVGDAVELEAGAPVSVFLNASPLHPLHATVRYAAYRAVQRPDGTSAYRVRATIVGDRNSRLGLKGTARIAAGHAPLVYWVLRRPLATVRQWLGL